MRVGVGLGFKLSSLDFLEAATARARVGRDAQVGLCVILVGTLPF